MNVHLHPTVNTPDKLRALQEATGMVPAQSNRSQSILLLTPEQAAIRAAMAAAK